MNPRQHPVSRRLFRRKFDRLLRRLQHLPKSPPLQQNLRQRSLCKRAWRIQPDSLPRLRLCFRLLLQLNKANRKKSMRIRIVRILSQMIPKLRHRQLRPRLTQPQNSFLVSETQATANRSARFPQPFSHQRADARKFNYDERQFDRPDFVASHGAQITTLPPCPPPPVYDSRFRGLPLGIRCRFNPLHRTNSPSNRTAASANISPDPAAQRALTGS